MNKAYKSVQEKNDANNSNRKKNQLKLYLYKFIKKKKKKIYCTNLIGRVNSRKAEVVTLLQPAQNRNGRIEVQKVDENFQMDSFQCMGFLFKVGGPSLNLEDDCLEVSSSAPMLDIETTYL